MIKSNDWSRIIDKYVKEGLNKFDKKFEVHQKTIGIGHYGKWETDLEKRDFYNAISRLIKGIK